MNSDDIDRILAKQETIVPSPHFLTSVMRAVAQEAASPPPLAFPWVRALPGLLATLAAVIGGSTALVDDPDIARTLEEQLGQLAVAAIGLELQWVALAVLVTGVSLVSGSGLARGGSLESER